MPPGERGRTRAPWKTTWAGKYDRYAHDLIPGWAQLLRKRGQLR